VHGTCPVDKLRIVEAKGSPSARVWLLSNGASWNVSQNSEGGDSELVSEKSVPERSMPNAWASMFEATVDSEAEKDAPVFDCKAEWLRDGRESEEPRVDCSPWRRE